MALGEVVPGDQAGVRSRPHSQGPWLPACVHVWHLGLRVVPGGFEWGVKNIGTLALLILMYIREKYNQFFIP